VASKAMPGIVAVAASDKGVLYEGAFGKRQLGQDAPMTLDTVVWIASMTKAITAAAAMQLVERGKLGLERPAREVVPEVAAAKVLEGFDTAFKLSPSQRARLAGVHQRAEGGALAPIEFELPQNPEFLMGGGGLYGTATDYLAFAQMIMHDGSFKRRPAPAPRNRRPHGAE